jgi:hypothetical protein
MFRMNQHTSLSPWQTLVYWSTWRCIPKVSSYSQRRNSLYSYISNYFFCKFIILLALSFTHLVTLSVSSSVLLFSTFLFTPHMLRRARCLWKKNLYHHFKNARDTSSSFSQITDSLANIWHLGEKWTCHVEDKKIKVAPSSLILLVIWKLCSVLLLILTLLPTLLFCT